MAVDLSGSETAGPAQTGRVGPPLLNEGGGVMQRSAVRQIQSIDATRTTVHSHANES